MKQIYLVALLFGLILFNRLEAQPDIAWQRCFGSSGFDRFSDVKLLNDNGFIACIDYSVSDFDAAGLYDFLSPATLVRFDSSFNIQWYSSFGGFDGASAFMEVKTLPDGGFIGFGYTYASDGDFTDSHGDADIILVRTDSLGQKIWSKSYGGPYNDFSSNFIATKDNGYLLCGYSNGSGGDIPGHYGSSFTDDIVVVKTDSSGNILWSKHFGTSGDDGPLSNPIEIDRGYYILNLGCIGDDFDMSGVGGDIIKRWLLKLDSLGNIVDENIIAGEADIFTIARTRMMAVNDLIYQTTASNPYTNIFDDVTGIGGTYDGALAIFNQDLDFIDLKVFGGTGTDFLDRFIIDDYGNIFMLGLSKSIDGDLPSNYNMGEGYDYWLLKLKPNLELEWSMNFGGGGNSEATGSHTIGDIIFRGNQLFFFGISQAIEVMPTFDVECGHYNPANIPSMDAWLVAFDELTLVEDQIAPQSNISVYPIPANNELRIISNIQEALPYEIFGLTGARLQSGTSEEQGVVDVSQIPNGVYYLKVYLQENQFQTISIVILH